MQIAIDDNLLNEVKSFTKERDIEIAIKNILEDFLYRQKYKKEIQIVDDVKQALSEVELIKSGKIQKVSARDFLNEI